MPRRSVRVDVRYDAPGQIRIEVEGPPPATSSVGRSREVGPEVRRLVTAAHGPDAEADLHVHRPAWLRDGDLVVLDEAVRDPQDVGAAPYAVVVGTLPVGGVLVVQAFAGAGVFAPEDLHVVGPEDVAPGVLAELRARSGAGGDATPAGS